MPYILDYEESFKTKSINELRDTIRAIKTLHANTVIHEGYESLRTVMLLAEIELDKRLKS